MVGQYYSRWFYHSIFSSRLLKKSWNQKSKLVQSIQVCTWFSNIVTALAANFHLWLGLLWLQTLFVIDSESCQTLFPSFYTPPSEEALASGVWLESEQTLFSQTGCWFRPAALHRIQFGTCCIVPMPYFYADTNEWFLLRHQLFHAL